MKRKKTLIFYVISCLLMIMIPMVVLTMFFYGVMVDNLLPSYENQSTAHLKSVQYTFDTHIEQIHKLSYQVKETKAFSKLSYSDDPLLNIEIAEILTDYLYTHPVIKQILYYDKSIPQLFSAEGTRSLKYSKQWEQIYFPNIENGLLTLLNGIEIPTWLSIEQSPYPTLILPVHHSGGECVSLLIFQLNIEGIYKLAEFESESDAYITISDEESVIFHSNSNSDDFTGNLDLHEKNSDWYVTILESKSNALTYTYAVPETEAFSALNQIQWQYLIYLIIIGFLGTLFTTFFVNKTYTPLKKIATKVYERFEDTVPVDGEIQIVSAAFDNLSAQNETLVKQNIDIRENEFFTALCMRNASTDAGCKAIAERWNVDLPKKQYRVLAFSYKGEFLSEYFYALRSITEITAKGNVRLNRIYHFALDTVFFVLHYDECNQATFKKLCDNLSVKITQIISQETKTVLSHRETDWGKLHLTCFAARQYLNSSEDKKTTENYIQLPKNYLVNLNLIDTELEINTLKEAAKECDVLKIQFVFNEIILYIQSSDNDYNAFEIAFKAIEILKNQISIMTGAPSLLGVPPHGRISREQLIIEMQKISNSYIDSIEKLNCQKETLSRLDEIKLYIDIHFTDYDFSVTTVAQHFNCSPSSISHRFKAEEGTSLSNYIIIKKMNKAKELLQSTQMSVAEIGAEIGYSQPSSFIRVFKSVVGKTPGDYRNAISGNR